MNLGELKNKIEEAERSGADDFAPVWVNDRDINEEAPSSGAYFNNGTFSVVVGEGN